MPKTQKAAFPAAAHQKVIAGLCVRSHLASQRAESKNSKLNAPPPTAITA